MNSAQFALFLLDLGHLRAPHRMGAVGARLETKRHDPSSMTNRPNASLYSSMPGGKGLLAQKTCPSRHCGARRWRQITTFPDVAQDYSLLGAGPFSGRLCLAAIPYLMHDRPFVQGIRAYAHIAEAIARGMATGRRRRLVS